MTEGNIAKWNVKEGESFLAGDVLLEIETDKASMDVEAQDDGIMAKITQGDGTKGIQVGARIGVIAEVGDDLSSLEIRAEESAAPPSPKEEASKPKPETTSESQAEAPPTSKPSAETAPQKPSGPPKKQTYPLLPSVEHLMHENGLDLSTIDKMTPTGPNNRLLKGDVLAYLGTVASSYPAELSSKIAKLSHLDLSNIKLAAPAPKAAPAPAPATEAIKAPIIPDSEVAIPISMKAVIEVQRRIQSTLGVFLPLSTFIARATDVANDNIPRSKTQAPTADELFNNILGLDKVGNASGVRGSFLPQITALSSAAPKAKIPKTKELDIIDILSGRTGPSPANLVGKPLPGMSGEINVFSVTVPKGDEKRAEVFLERVKAVLESEPGRLVL
jgi:pyruvate/2-oxoglutarate dehydrogenase complex dihydrolipoamide acyltransferase (E2) component